MNGYFKKIEQIKFGLMSPDDIREMSVLSVEFPYTYEDDGFPIEKGLMDPRLGVIDPDLVCRTCGLKGGECPGHFGSIELARPVIHIGFSDVIHKILRSTCNICGRILLSEDELKEYGKKIANAMENKESISEILKKLQNETKKVEMSEAKLNDIVDKIMKELYPEEEDNYNDADREDILSNILNQLYMEAYMERDETEEKHQFKYIDPKNLCPHCKKNQSIRDIESNFKSLETKNSQELKKIHKKAISKIEEEFDKKIIKIDKKLEYYKYYGNPNSISYLKEQKAEAIAEFEENFDEKVFEEVKRKTVYFVKQYLQELIQEPIILDKPVTIRQGNYKLTASEVRERLENISDEDSFILGVNPDVARPEWMVLTVLPVPPVTVRPSITLITGERSEDDLTHKLVDILRINQRLIENMESGAPQLIVEDLWELLQYHVTTYFDNEASCVPPSRHRSGRPLKNLIQRLKGREGRFRSNLSGKRVNFSARTVISPDPNISINEVGVPEMIAKDVTVPAYVTDWNIKEMKKYIKNGPEVHPGANNVIFKDGSIAEIDVDFSKKMILRKLEPGCIVERHLIDGDMVLLNRQPSLHRMSIMAHEVRVLPYKTFRLNLCVCPPYNADFDGDEMNMHVFQTDESRAEAKSLMRVQEHILSPRFGGPIIGAIHDHISGGYLLTRDGVEFTEEQALQFIRKSHLPIPKFKDNKWILKYDSNFDENSFIYKEKGDMWTGKELFSLLLPNDLNLEYDAEISKCPAVFPPEDANVVIINGILVQGVIDESAYGSFSGKILDKIVKEYGPGRAKEFLDRSTDLAICGIMKTGITTSLNDEEIPSEAQDRINEHLDKKMAEVDKLVESYEEGYLQALPGRSLEETLEMKIMQVLGEARDMSGQIAENYLTMGKQSDDDSYEHVMAVENHSVVMARTGARGSMLNLTQITACVGQQAVRGGRIERGYLNRTLPHFKKGELGAKAKGFVHSSYKSGLDPIEFFFHAMGGREGLVDTAIRTAQSGYMQRRLVNALQDLQVKQSGLVTDNQGNVIQTMFGEDGVDPAKSDFGKVIDLNKLIEDIRLGNLQDKRMEIFNRQKNVNTLKIKTKILIKDLKLLKQEIIDEINNINDYDIDSNFDSFIGDIENLLEILNKYKNEENIEEFTKIYNDSENRVKNIRLEFNNEINRINSIILKIKKEHVNKTIESIEKVILNNSTDIDLQFNNFNNVKIYWRELFFKIDNLKENLSDNIKIILNPILNLLFEIENKFNDISNRLNNLKNENSKFKSNLNYLFEYDEINDDFNHYSNSLNSEIQKLNERLLDMNKDINQITVELDEVNSKFDAILIDLNIKKVQKSSEENVSDKLREYHNLLNEGIITQDEFNELKRQLIFGNK